LKFEEILVLRQMILQLLLETQESIECIMIQLDNFLVGLLGFLDGNEGSSCAFHIALRDQGIKASSLVGMDYEENSGRESRVRAHWCKVAN
jgi:hypothetical protein